MLKNNRIIMIFLLALFFITIINLDKIKTVLKDSKNMATDVNTDAKDNTYVEFYDNNEDTNFDIKVVTDTATVDKDGIVEYASKSVDDIRKAVMQINDNKKVKSPIELENGVQIPLKTDEDDFNKSKFFKVYSENIKNNTKIINGQAYAVNTLKDSNTSTNNQNEIDTNVTRREYVSNETPEEGTRIYSMTAKNNSDDIIIHGSQFYVIIFVGVLLIMFKIATK